MKKYLFGFVFITCALVWLVFASASTVTLLYIDDIDVGPVIQDHIIIDKGIYTYIKYGFVVTPSDCSISMDTSTLVDGTNNLDFYLQSGDEGWNGKYVCTYGDDGAGGIAVIVSANPLNIDATAPEITILGNNPENVIVNNTYIDVGATSTDNIDGDITSSITSTSTVDTSTLGTYSVIYTVIDSAGNIASSTRVINVVANLLSMDSSLSNLTLSLGTLSPIFNSSILNYSVLLPAGSTTTPNTFATATDSLTSIIQISQATDITSTTTSDRTTDILVIAEDGVSTTLYSIVFNISTTSLYYIDDVDIGPTIQDHIIINPGIYSSIKYGFVSTSSECNTSMDTSILVDGTNNLDFYLQHGDEGWNSKYICVYGDNEIGSTTAMVSTNPLNIDATAPEITILGGNPTSVIINKTYVDAGATSTDNYDGDMTSKIYSTSTIDTSTLGTYSVNYSVTDTAGNTASSTRIVIVRNQNTDSSLSSLTTSLGLLVPNFSSSTLNYSVTIPINTTSTPAIFATSTDPQATTSTNIAFDVTSATTSDRTTNILVTAENGIATTTYNVVFNVSTDMTPPAITVIGKNPINLTVGDTYTDSGATSTDNVDGDLTSNISSTSTVNASIAGVYSVIYTVSDFAGNKASSTRIVNINNPPAPSNGGGGWSGGGGFFTGTLNPQNSTTSTTTIGGIGIIDLTPNEIFSIGEFINNYLRQESLAEEITEIAMPSENTLPFINKINEENTEINTATQPSSSELTATVLNSLKDTRQTDSIFSTFGNWFSWSLLWWFIALIILILIIRAIIK